MKELKEQLQQGTFYYYKSNLFIKSEITRVVEIICYIGKGVS